MNISILTHSAHGGKGGIDKYVENVINAFESNRNISHIRIFSKRKGLYRPDEIFWNSNVLRNKAPAELKKIEKKIADNEIGK